MPLVRVDVEDKNFSFEEGVWSPRQHGEGAMEFSILLCIDREDGLPRVKDGDQLPNAIKEDALLIMLKLTVYVPKLVLHLLIDIGKPLSIGSETRNL